LKHTLVVAFVVIATLTIPTGNEAAGNSNAAGRFAVEESRTEVFDAVRRRAIPIKIYRPTPPAGRAPLVIFSHGLGSSREGYAYLGRYWAAHGYIVIHLQHAGSDRTLGVRALYHSARAGDVGGHRPLDISAVLDALQSSQREGSADPALAALQGQIDFDRIAVAGHSFGAYTVLASVGLLIDFPDKGDRSFADRRIKAAIAISAPRMFGAPEARDYREICVPILHVTGSRDRTPLLNTYTRHRRIPFEAIEMTEIATENFLDAYLKGSPGALKWLKETSFGAAAKIERR